MSLVGNLEDLGLGEILQIVSLSRKSGVLTLESTGRVGKVVFLNGQVIRATTSASRINLGDLLVRNEMVSVEALKKALFIQRNSDKPQRLGSILSEKFNVPQEKIEEAAKEQIEKVVYSFFGWSEGSFNFELGEPSELASGHVNPLQLMLDSGLNPQWLAMEGSRIIDEKRHRGESLEDEVEEPILDLADLLGDEAAALFDEPAPVPAAAPATAVGDAPPAPREVQGPPVYLVDDDQLTAQVLARQLREHQLDVKVFTSAKDYLRALPQAVEAGENPLLLVDLVMPKVDGTGILGGVEIIKKVREDYPDLTLLLMTDHPTAEVEQKLAKFKLAAVLRKPKKGDLGVKAGQAELAALADEVFRHATGSDPAPTATGYHFGEELLKEVDDAELQAHPGKIQPTPGIHVLGGMLQELNNPSLGGGIILLVLRFASELMNRAVIFFVKGDEIVGLGQFGLDGLGDNADALVRQIKVPLREESIFTHVFADLTPRHTTFGDSKADRYIMEKLGKGRPTDVFLGPIISEGKVVAIIYGDNLPKQEPVGDTESFEIFLSQAGMAMERALQERRVKGSQAV
jgi:CheY-like chemotaxis protein